MTDVQLAPELECKRCGWKWRPRVEEVKLCPHCKSPNWNAEPKIYARPDGGHYHRRKDCVMLRGGQFEEIGYKEVTVEEVKKRKLRPCACVNSNRRKEE